MLRYALYLCKQVMYLQEEQHSCTRGELSGIMLILQKQQQMFVPLFAIHDQIHLRKELIKYRDTNHSQAALGG